MSKMSSHQERRLHIPGTRLEWQGIRGWLDTLYAVDRTMRASSKSYARIDKLYRALRQEDIRRCRDLDALDELSDLLRRGKHYDGILFRGIFRARPRSEIGELIVETDNQRDWVRRGCPERVRGPRLDPAWLPDDRLDALIQSHRDIDMVERLRAEKQKRVREDLERTDIPVRK